jgi:hypothetical protein
LRQSTNAWAWIDKTDGLHLDRKFLTEVIILFIRRFSVISLAVYNFRVFKKKKGC